VLTVQPEVLHVLAHATAICNSGFVVLTVQLVISSAVRQKDRPVGHFVSRIFGLSGAANVCFLVADLLRITPPDGARASAALTLGLTTVGTTCYFLAFPDVARCAEILGSYPWVRTTARTYVGVLAGAAIYVFAIVKILGPNVGAKLPADALALESATTIISMSGIAMLLGPAMKYGGFVRARILIAVAFAPALLQKVVTLWAPLGTDPLAGKQFFLFALINIVLGIVIAALAFAAVAQYHSELSASEAQALALAEQRAATLRREQVLASLAVGFGHDVNNIMQTVVVCAESVGRKVSEHPQQRHIARILTEACQRGAEIGEQLMAMGGSGERAQETINPAEWLRTTAPSLQLLAPTWTVDVLADASVPAVRCNSRDLERAITNLVINARDASPVGSRIRVRCARCGQADGAARAAVEQDWVCMSVEDQGVGIPKDKLAMVFDGYYTTKGSRGNGLGLPTVKAVMRRSGGHVDIHSEPGVGTVVTLRFPAYAQSPVVA
jgi:signal transduction histidine kinase